MGSERSGSGPAAEPAARGRRLSPLGQRQRREASTLGLRARPMSEINMTPLIDVMLVLLVIFIVTAPLLSSRLALQLPRAEGGAASDAPAALALAIDAAGAVYLGDQPATSEQVAERARAAARRDPATEVLLRADSRVPYGRVAEVIGWVQQAGLARIGLVTEEAPR